MDRREFAFLETLVFFTEAKTVLEVGVQRGDMAVYLAKAADRNDGRYVGMDIWSQHGLKNQFEAIGSKDSVSKKLIAAGAKNFELVQIDTLNDKTTLNATLKSLFPDGIDFAFIDACHSYYGVASDFFSVYPFMSEVGVIAFHDTLRIDGCREFMLDLRTKYYDGTFDLIDFPFGSGSRRCGVSVLSKRAFPNLPLGIDEVCGSLNTARNIELKEVAWYEAEVAAVSASIEKFSLVKEDLITDNIGFYNRKKFS